MRETYEIRKTESQIYCSCGVKEDDWKDQKRNFQNFLHKLQSRLASWKSKLLSQTSHLTLIKSNFQPNLIYKMSSILFNHAQMKQIDSITSKFFWDDEDEKRKIHLVAN